MKTKKSAFKYKLYLYLLISICFAFSCSNSNSDELSGDRDAFNITNPKKILKDNNNPISINLSNNLQPGRLTTSKVIDSNYNLIKLETTGKSLIGEITKVIVDKNKIYVLDNKVSKKLFCFDNNGKFLYVVGDKGKGPGEYDDPIDFDINGDQIYVIDRQCRVLIYDINGKYKNIIKLPLHSTQLVVLNPNSIFYYTHEINSFNNSYLLQADAQMNLKSADFTIQSKHISNYGQRHTFSKNGEKVLFKKFLTDTLYEISPSKISAKYVFNFSGKSKSPSLFKDTKQIDLAFNNSDIKNLGLFETSNHLIFQYNISDYIYKAYYNKLTKQISVYKTISDDLFLGGLNLNVVGNKDDNLIYTIQIALILETLQTIKDQKSPEEYLEIKKMFTNLFDMIKGAKEDDNPYLIFSKINSKIYEN